MYYPENYSEVLKKNGESQCCITELSGNLVFIQLF